MRFVCDSCRAQYMISDDKIGAKGVKIRCKKCGHVIVVRPAGAAAPKDDGAPDAPSAEATATAAASNGAAGSNAAAQLASLGTPPEGGLFTGVEEDEIGAVFDQILNSGSQKIPAAEPAEARESKPSTPDAVRKLAEEASEPDEPKAAPPANDWYVAIDEKQVGPLTVEKIKEHWDRGEVGPDSLCWRAGFSDWIPLSEAAELASVLAPRPARPVIVAPAAMAASVSAPAPVESAFSAGAAAKNNRPEIPAAPALGNEPTSSGWKPSAASVLASLVKEENEALSKPPPKPAVEEKPSVPGLLDLPSPEPALAPRAASMMAAAAEPMRAPQPAAMPYTPGAPAPAYAQPAPAYGQPAYASAGYPQPAYPGYPPGAVPGPQGGNNKMVMVVAAAAVVVVLLGGGMFFAFRGSPAQPSEQPSVGSVTPAPAPATATPPAPAPSETKAQPPANPAAVANPSATPTPAPGTAPAPAAGTATVAGGTAPPPAVAAVTPTPAPPPATPPAPPATETAVAKASPGPRTGSSTRTSSNSRPERTESVGATTVPAKAKPADDGLGDDFDDLFGTKKKPGAKQGGSSGTPSTYVPPEPGGGGSVQETLSQSDIMTVVVNNKPAIKKCVDEQKKKDPGISGRLVMRWSIQTNGRTTGVAVKSDEFKKTYMASCISGLIKGWSFPKHRKQGDPIDFPFIF